MFNWIKPMAAKAAFILGCTLAASASMSNVLVNSGFESNAVLDAPNTATISGWGSFGTAQTASANGKPTHTGIGSLELTAATGGDSGVFQSFTASAGDIWNLQGFMRKATINGSSFGLLKIVWLGGTTVLEPGIVDLGRSDPDMANPGIQALPLLDSMASPTDWTFAQAQGVAPIGTTEVRLFALFVGANGDGAAYFDDLRGQQVPEPGSMALVLLGLLALPMVRTRHS